jgi:hypothetical protein
MIREARNASPSPLPSTEVITVTQPKDWPFEQPADGTLRPWYLTATGYLVALFSDPEEARRTQRGLLEHKVPRTSFGYMSPRTSSAWCPGWSTNAP